MSFSRVNPPGWAVGDKFTSAQANALDVDHANALDKTTAGDALSGVVTMATTASLQAQFAGNIQGQAASAIKATVAGGIASGVTSGIALTGASTDFPTFGVSGGSPRTRNIAVDLGGAFVATAIATSGNVNLSFVLGGSNAPLYGVANNTGQAFAGFFTNVVNSGSNSVWTYMLPLKPGMLHNGATLTSATLLMQGQPGHTSLPTVMPAFQIGRSLLTTSAGGFSALGGAAATDPTNTLANYKLNHTWSYTCTTGNVIDTTQYGYYLFIWDEGGTNAITGNTYASITLTFGSITDMRFA